MFFFVCSSLLLALGLGAPDVSRLSVAPQLGDQERRRSDDQTYGPFTHVLSDDSKPYTVEMTWTMGADLIEVAVSATNVGTVSWFGIGWSSAGNMLGAEIQRLKLDSGDATLTTMQAHAATTPSAISGAEPALLRSYSYDGTDLAFEFSRPLTSCVDPALNLRQEMETWILYAFSSITAGGGFHYHSTNREAKLVDLRNPQPATMVPDYSNDASVSEYTFGVETLVPANHTAYLRTMHPVPSLNFSIIAHQVEVGEAQHVHHLFIYYCDPHWDPHFDNGDASTGNRIHEDGFVNPEMFENCGNVMIAWAVGGQSVEVWPEDMAMVVPEGVEWLQMEIHYDNPHNLEGNVDRTNITLWWIEGERDVNVGNSIVGPAQTSMLIPAGESNFEYKAVIGAGCTGQLPHPIHVHHVLPHMHQVGVAFKFRIIRQGAVVHHLEWLYDFNKQQYFLTPNMTIEPEDELEVTCVYDTSALSEPVSGGEASSEEMCYAIFDYYPRIPTWGGQMMAVNDPAGLAGFNTVAEDQVVKDAEAAGSALYYCNVMGTNSGDVVVQHRSDNVAAGQASVQDAGFVESGYTHDFASTAALPGLLEETAQCRDVLPDTFEPTLMPTLEPSFVPTWEPTGEPTHEPTGEPTQEPTPATVSVTLTQVSGITQQQAQDSGPQFAQAAGVDPSKVTVESVTEITEPARRRTDTTGTFDIDYDINVDDTSELDQVTTTLTSQDFTSNFANNVAAANSIADPSTITVADVVANYTPTPTQAPVIVEDPGEGGSGMSATVIGMSTAFAVAVVLALVAYYFKSTCKKSHPEQAVADQIKAAKEGQETTTTTTKGGQETETPEGDIETGAGGGHNLTARGVTLEEETPAGSDELRESLIPLSPANMSGKSSSGKKRFSLALVSMLSPKKLRKQVKFERTMEGDLVEAPESPLFVSPMARNSAVSINLKSLETPK